MVMEVHFEANAEGYVHQHPHEQMDYSSRAASSSASTAR